MVMIYKATQRFQFDAELSLEIPSLQCQATGGCHGLQPSM